jgi:hypothetical protein
MELNFRIGRTAAADDERASGSYRVARAYSTGQAAAIPLRLTDDFVNDSFEFLQKIRDRASAPQTLPRSVAAGWPAS